MRAREEVHGRVQAGGCAGARLLREGPDVRFGFIARHRAVWPIRCCAASWRSRIAASMNGKDVRQACGR